MKYLKVSLILLVILVISFGIFTYPVESNEIQEILEKYDDFLPGNAIPIHWSCMSFYDSYMHFYCSQKTEDIFIFTYGANNLIESTYFSFSKPIPLASFVHAFGRWKEHKRYSSTNYWVWDSYQAYGRTKNLYSSLFIPIQSLIVEQ